MKTILALYFVSCNLPYSGPQLVHPSQPSGLLSNTHVSLKSGLESLHRPCVLHQHILYQHSSGPAPLVSTGNKNPAISANGITKS